MLATVNHPLIAAIYGYEEADDIHALILGRAQTGISAF